MLLYNFPQREIDTFSHGSFPKVRRLSHTFANPTWQYALHMHPDEIELLYIAGGQATITLDKRIYSAAAGDILFVDQGITHSVVSSPENPSDVWCLSAENVEFIDCPAGQLIAAHTHAGEHCVFIEQTMRQIEAFSKGMDIPVQAACNHLCAALIVLFRQLLLQSAAFYENRSSSLASDILAYINLNYDQHIDLDSLSEVFFSSASHISRVFKQEYNVSPINCLIDKRLSEAKWLLINTNDPLHVVALHVGYQNVYYFIKLFTKRVGVTPAAYRRQYTAVETE